MVLLPLFAVVLWQVVIAVWIGADYPYRQVLRFVIYSFGAIAYLPMLLVLWREQCADRLEHEES